MAADDDIRYPVGRFSFKNPYSPEDRPLFLAQLAEAPSLLRAAVAGLSDAQLLERFVGRRDATSFEALVARHGPMVLSVCRGILKDPNDAEDAFQATFLILPRTGALSRKTTVLSGSSACLGRA